MGDILITKRDGRIEIERADDSILVSLELMRHGDLDRLKIDFDRLSFVADNMTVEYRVVGFDPRYACLVCERVN